MRQHKSAQANSFRHTTFNTATVQYVQFNVRKPVFLQCKLPELPVDCLVSLTFTPAYVDRMRSPVITHVTKLVLEIQRRYLKVVFIRIPFLHDVALLYMHSRRSKN
jgi:hypothetical protein